MRTDRMHETFVRRHETFVRSEHTPAMDSLPPKRMQSTQDLTVPKPCYADVLMMLRAYPGSIENYCFGRCGLTK